MWAKATKRTSMRAGGPEPATHSGPLPLGQDPAETSDLTSGGAANVGNADNDEQTEEQDEPDCVDCGLDLRREPSAKRRGKQHEEETSAVEPRERDDVEHPEVH